MTNDTHKHLRNYYICRICKKRVCIHCGYKLKYYKKFTYRAIYKVRLIYCLVCGAMFEPDT